LKAKGRSAPKPLPGRVSTPASQEAGVARLSLELKEALEQQTALGEVLKVISSSRGELEPVFDAVLENATRICEASFGSLMLHEGDAFRRVALHNAPADYLEFAEKMPLLSVSSYPSLTRIIETRVTHQIADMSESEPLAPIVKFGHARTLVNVPMLKEDEVVGVMGIYRREVRPFTDKQVKLLDNFATQAVIAIENARLLNELRESLEEQTATSDVLKVISSSPGDLEPVFASMLEKAVRICDAAFGNIYRWDGDALHLFAMHNTPPGFADFRRRSPLPSDPQTATGRAIATKTAVHVADLAVEQAYIEQRDPNYVAAIELGGVRTFLAVPMIKENELVGLFTVYRQEVRPFTAKQIALVTNFAAQAVIAIENARLLTELRESLQEQTATSEVLQVISSSPGERVPRAFAKRSLAIFCFVRERPSAQSRGTVSRRT
jgi:GAF domain-containing protein